MKETGGDLGLFAVLGWDRGGPITVSRWCAVCFTLDIFTLLFTLGFEGDKDMQEGVTAESEPRGYGESGNQTQKSFSLQMAER